MLPRERVLNTLEHKPVDKMPTYFWLNRFTEELTNKYGSMEAVYDKYDFSLKHIFPKFSQYDKDSIAEIRQANSEIDPDIALQVKMPDVNDMSLYQSIIDDIQEHKINKGRWVYIQTPGVFEPNNQIFGIEQHLMNTLLYEDEIHEVYNRTTTWIEQYVNNCIDLGVDMVHISDDWGSQRELLFSPNYWWSHIYPYQKRIVDTAKKRGVKVSLHSDGHIMQVIDGVIKLGFDVVHPYQESAGMDFTYFKQNLMDKFTIMGGLDVQTTIGYNNYDNLTKEIKRVMDMFRNGGMLFCTSHMVQPHCTMEELEYAMEFVCDYRDNSKYGK